MEFYTRQNQPCRSRNKRNLFNRRERKLAVSVKFLLENPIPNFQRDPQFTATNVLRTETSNTVIDTNDFSSWNILMRRTQTVMKAVNIFRKRPVTNSYEDERHHLLRQA